MRTEGRTAALRVLASNVKAGGSPGAGSISLQITEQPQRRLWTGTKKGQQASA